MLSAMQQGLAKPTRRVLHSGVLDFTAGDGCVCLPSWMMAFLGVSDGDELCVSNVTLPKGRYVRLQPHTVLKDAKTKQKLEAALRDFTTLTLNTTISMEAMDGLQLKILELKPNKHGDSVRIVDTDLIVEFEAALDGSSGDDAHFDRPLLLDADDADCAQDTITDEVAMGALRFYKVKLLHRVENVRVAVTPDQQHDLDLYASFRNLEPGSNADNYEFHCGETGKAQLVINVEYDDHDDDEDEDTEKPKSSDRAKWLYIGVHAFEDHHALV